MRGCGGCLCVGLRGSACRRCVALLRVDCSSDGMFNKPPPPGPPYFRTCMQIWAAVWTTLLADKPQNRSVWVQ